MNREFAFYCHELDCIVIQVIYDECMIAFEWMNDIPALMYTDYSEYLTDDLLMIPLGHV